VIASATKIEALPPFDFDSGAANTSLIDITSANVADNTIGSVSTTTVTLGTPIVSTGQSLVGQIVYNSRVGNYAVIVGQTVTAGNIVSITIDVSTTPLLWYAGAILKFYKSNMLFTSSGFTRTLIGQPYLQTIDAFYDLLESGMYENSSGQSLWIGRIGTKLYTAGVAKSYFGGAFTFNGLYVGKLVEDFTTGAFRSDTHHIQVLKSSAPAATEVDQPTSDFAAVGSWVNAASNPVTVNGAGPLSFFANVGDASDASYVAIATNSTYFQVRDSALTSGLSANPDGYVNILVRAKTGNQGAPYYVGFLIDALEYLTDPVTHVVTTVSRGFIGPIGISDTGFKNFILQVPVAAFTNINNLGVMVSYQNGTTSLVVSLIQATIDLNPPVTGVDNTKQNPDYIVNFSLELDGFIETSLIYTGLYGAVNATASYQDTNGVTLVYNTTTNRIGVKIQSDLTALINRRVTAINVYVGTYIASGYVWRFCRRIDINDSQWIQSGYGHKIEFVLGNEVNTGVVYEDKTGRSSTGTSEEKISILSKPSSRSLVVNNTEKNIVYFSGISENGVETALIPDSNFFVVNDTIGDIVWLYSVGQKLIIFKSQSILSLDVASVSSAPRLNVVTRNRGLASLLSVASKGNRALYVSYDGIYETDGFSDQCINGDWINYFQVTYTKAILEASIGWYDVSSDSYYIQFNPSAGVYDLWAFDFASSIWRQEEFIYTDPSVGRTEKYGAVKFVCSTPDNRILFADDVARTTTSYMQLYQFPRDDSLYTNKIRRNSATVEIGTRCYFKTNPVDDTVGLNSAYYIDGGYVKSNVKAGGGVLFASAEPAAAEIASVNLNIYDGATLVKSIVMLWGRNESTVPCRFPLSRFAVQNQVYARGLFVVKEFGLYHKQFIKGGSVKQLA
jgi:hypothetical protein